MKYTFLLPAYKGRFLDEMLRSIQGQTYTDFKVIISDDCSPEDLRSICKPYLSDSRFSYRRNEVNMGSKSLVSHWNLLVNLCDTEYLILASDDDVYNPLFLEEIDKLTEKYPLVELFRARVRRINSNNKTLKNDGLFEEFTDCLHFIYQSQLSNHIHCIANYCFLTNSLKRNKGFIDFPKAWASDDATTIMMSKNGCCNTSKVLFDYRTSEINISSKYGDEYDSKEKVTAILAYYNWFIRFFDQVFCGEYEPEPILPTIVKLCLKKNIEDEMLEYVVFCRWKDFFLFARRCQRELGLSFPILFYLWLRRKVK